MKLCDSIYDVSAVSYNADTVIGNFRERRNSTRIDKRYMLLFQGLPFISSELFDEGQLLDEQGGTIAIGKCSRIYSQYTGSSNAVACNEDSYSSNASPEQQLFNLPAPLVPSDDPLSEAQIIRKPRTKRSKEVRPMDALIFTDILDPLHSLPPVTMQHLYSILSINKYQIPSRKTLRELSLSLGVSQNRMKRWFTEHLQCPQTHTPSTITPIINTPQLASDTFQEIADIENRIKEMDASIEKLQLELDLNATRVNRMMEKY